MLKRAWIYFWIVAEVRADLESRFSSSTASDVINVIREREVPIFKDWKAAHECLLCEGEEDVDCQYAAGRADAQYLKKPSTQWLVQVNLNHYEAVQDLVF